MYTLLLGLLTCTWSTGCNEFGHFKRDCPNKKNNKRKERSETHVTEAMGEPEKKAKKEEVKDLYY